jgi:hypothetical protein
VSIPGRGDRWKSKIKQNKDGDWVKVYYQTYGGPNKRTRQRRNLQAKQAQAQAQAQAQQVAPTERNIETHQLVNLRADFG